MIVRARPHALPPRRLPDRVLTAAERGLRRCQRASVLLCGLLSAAGAAQARCSQIRTDDSSSRTLVLSQTTEPDRPLSSWSSPTSSGFNGCWTNVGHPINYQPGPHGLTHVRDVTIDGTVFPAYGWGPSTPLVIFGMQATAFQGSTPYPVAIERPTQINGTAARNGSLPISLRYRFIARGGPMAVSGPLIIRGSSTHRASSSLGSIQHAHEASVSLVRQTCTLSDTQQTLPDARAANLPSVGSTSGERSIQVHITCPSFGPGIELSLADANNAGNTGSVLSPAPDAVASGVGVELLRGGQPVQFGRTWTHQASQNGTTPPIRFTARYHRTSATMLPGLVKGIATLTATYH